MLFINFFFFQKIQHRLETWMSSVCLLRATLQATFVTMWLAHQAMILLSSQVILEMSVFLVQNLTLLLTHWYCNKCMSQIECSKLFWNKLFLLASYFYFIQRNWFDFLKFQLIALIYSIAFESYMKNIKANDPMTNDHDKKKTCRPWH